MSTAKLEALASRTITYQSRARRSLAAVNLVATAWAAFIERQRIRRLENELLELDDRMLRDIGLTRTEISYLVRHGLDARQDRTTN